MKYCPKCRLEYRDEFTTCSDCEEELVDNLEPEIIETPEPSHEEYDNEEYLMTVSNDSEADIIESLLGSCNIPLVRRYSVTGDYLGVVMGGSNLGLDLYVPSKCIEEAKGIIQTNIDVDKEIDDENIYENESQNEDEFTQSDVNHEFDEQRYSDEYERKRRIRTWIILLIFFIPGLILIFSGFFAQIFKLFFR